MDDNLPPSLTSDIWSSGQQESYLSFTCHIIDADFRPHMYSLGAVSMKSQAHTADVIGMMWHDLLDKSLHVDLKTVQPVLTTDGATNMVAASQDEL